jgi:hypothetical protein
LKSYLTRSDDSTDATASTIIFCRSTTLPIIARLRPGTTPDGLPQAGVLGSDLIADGSVLDLDLVNGHLEWYEVATAKPPPAGSLVLPVEYRNGWLIASGIEVEGRDVKLMVDTGASNVIVVAKTPRANEVREDTVDGTASAITLFHAEGAIDLGDGITRHVPIGYCRRWRPARCERHVVSVAGADRAAAARPGRRPWRAARSCP